MATESFFSNASLAYLASAGAGKDGKTYSIKPTDGTGDFTFSRGSNLAATRVGADGLIEKGRENLLLRSNDFSNATWIKTNSSVTSGQSGYDGSSDAWLLNKPTDGSFSYFSQGSISLSGIWTNSVYAKKNTLNFIWFRSLGGSDVSCFFDLENGTTGTSNNTILTSIEAVGTDGWYRCSITANTSNNSFLIYPTQSNGNLTSGVGSVFLQDAQAEIGLAATDVISTGATTGKAGLLEDEPRFDYSGGATCPSLLLEPSRTNLLPYSEYLGGLNTFNATPVHNQTTSPDGLTNGVKLDDGATSNVHRVDYNKAITSGQDYCFSAFVKRGNIDYAVMKVYDGSNKAALFNLTDGSVESTIGTLVDYYSEDYGNGWYRLIVIYNAGSASASTQLQLCDAPSSFEGSGNAPYQGANNYIYVYGMMEEQGSYPTSYIPNHSGGSVTRGADNAAKAEDSLISTQEFTLFFEHKALGSSGSDWIYRVDIAGTALDISFYATNSNGLNIYLNANGGYKFGLFSNDGFTIGSNSKVALSYDGDRLAYFINGSLYDSATGVSFIDDVNTLLIRGQKSIAHKQCLVFPEALSEADCISLTTL